MLVAAFVVVVALFFTDLQVVHPFITFTTILLTAIVFSIAGLFNAIFAKTFDDISIIPTFVLTPLTYLGGVFFSISLLPPFWQKVALANPILYMVNAFRYGMLGSSDIPIGVAYVIMIGFARRPVRGRALDAEARQRRQGVTCAAGSGCSSRPRCSRSTSPSRSSRRPRPQPRYNLTPGQAVAVVREHDGRRRLDALQWGLIPFWAKDASDRPPAHQRAARQRRREAGVPRSLERRRCLIPASGFYEWSEPKGGRKRPHFIRPGERAAARARGTVGALAHPERRQSSRRA